MEARGLGDCRSRLWQNRFTLSLRGCLEAKEQLRKFLLTRDAKGRDVELALGSKSKLPRHRRCRLVLESVFLRKHCPL